MSNLVSAFHPSNTRIHFLTSADLSLSSLVRAHILRQGLPAPTDGCVVPPNLTEEQVRDHIILTNRV